MLRKLILGGIWLCCALTATEVNIRLSNDRTIAGGYVSLYKMATGNPYTDAVLTECSNSGGRQNEPAVAVDPRNTSVLVGSSNDYCGVYVGTSPPMASGPIWLGYYRSENGGTSFLSSLVPGYPGDTSPYASLAKIRTASSGDPVIAWDGHGRVYFGSESSDDPAGSKKTFGDLWVARFDNPDGPGGNFMNDGKRYLGTEIVAKGSSAPNLLGKFNDKTSIEADRTGGPCDANVYFAWSRFNGLAGGSNIYFARSTDLGKNWSTPMSLTPDIMNVQDPDIAVTGNGHVYVTFGMGATVSGQTNAVAIARSADCGKTFSKPVVVTSLIPYDAQDISLPQPIPPGSALGEPLLKSEPAAAGSLARDCGDFASACKSGFTFFRRASAPRSTADQYDAEREWIYIVYEATKPGTEVDTGTTYGSIRPGRGSQSGVYFIRYNGATGASTAPVLIDDQSVGHQFFPDISADGGVLHALWWDSRLDPAYSPARPIGNDASGNVTASLDVWAARSDDHGANWVSRLRVTEVSSNGNYEQFADRTIPFAGDYLWITSMGGFAYGAWTDWRNTVAGADPRETSPSNADVLQCRKFSAATGWSSDTCPRDGGLDQNIYGNPMP